MKFPNTGYFASRKEIEKKWKVQCFMKCNVITTVMPHQKTAIVSVMFSGQH